MTLKFLSNDEKEFVEAKGLCYGEIMVLLCRILCDDNWKYQIIPDSEEKKDEKNIA